MKKTFVTLFPGAQNVHLTKDIGLIPFYFCKEFDFDSYIATFSPESDYANLDLVDGLRIERIKKIRALGWKWYLKKKYGEQYLEYLSCKRYLAKNSRKIDVLQVYHVHDKYIGEYVKLYKKRNPCGVVFLKLDLGDKTFAWVKNAIDNHECTKKEYIRIMDLIHYSDVVSVESKKFLPEINRLFMNKAFYLPCGCYETDTVQDLINWNQKTNTFLTVGNMSEWKGTHFLIDAFVTIADRCNWNLMLVGPVAPSIDEKIRDVLAHNSQLRKRLIIRGSITDRKVLYELYRQSKVFVLPSKGESFGIVFLEAKFNGCFIILTDTVAPKCDLIHTTNDGRIIHSNDVSELANAMLEATKYDVYNKENYARIREDYFSRFSYSVTLGPIYDRIKELINERSIHEV